MEEYKKLGIDLALTSVEKSLELVGVRFVERVAEFLFLAIRGVAQPG